MRRGRVEDVAARHQVAARLERGLEARLAHVAVAHVALGLRVLEDPEDRARGDARVHVRRPVEGVEDGHVLAARLLHEHLLVVALRALVLDFDRHVLLLGREHAHASREPQCVLEDVVRDHVELLLLLALHVDVPAVEVARQAADARPTHQIADRLRRRLDGREDALQLAQLGVRDRRLDHEPRQRDARLLAHLVEDGRPRRAPDRWWVERRRLGHGRPTPRTRALRHQRDALEEAESEDDAAEHDCMLFASGREEEEDASDKDKQRRRRRERRVCYTRSSEHFLKGKVS